MSIDWSDPKAQISEHFTVKDATYLPSWQIYHTPSDAEKESIIKAASMMEEIRSYLEKPINVHCWIRPSIVNCPTSAHHGKNYNGLVGGAPASSHILGLAVDWNPSSMTCDEARSLLLSQLEHLQIRMEDRPGSNWVHTDISTPRPNRFFKP